MMKPIIHRIDGGYSVCGGLCSAGWYGGILTLEDVDLTAFERENPDDYERQVACSREWQRMTVGRPRRIVLARSTAAEPVLTELACAERIDGPVCPKEGVGSPTLVWTERRAGAWHLLLYREESTRTVLRHDGILRAPQVAEAGARTFLACERDGADGEGEVLLLDADGVELHRMPGRNPRLVAVEDGLALLTEQCSRNGIHLKVSHIRNGGVKTEVEIRHNDYTFHADLAWSGSGDEVFVAAECCPAFGEGSQLGKHREILVWRCAEGRAEPLAREGGGALPVERRAFQSIGPENLPPIHPFLLVEQGRPAVLFLQFRYHGFKTFGWDVFRCGWDGGTWDAPVRLSPSLCPPDTGFGVVPFEGRYVGMFPALENVGVAGRTFGHRVEIFDFDASRRLERFEIPEEKSSPYAVPVACRDIVMETPPLPESYPGRTLIWGDLHVHSTYSKCVGAVDGSPDENVRFARDVLGCQVLTLTEHSHSSSNAELTWCMDRLESLAGDRRVVLYCTEPENPSGRHTNWYAYDREIYERLLTIVGSHKANRLRVYRHAVEELPPGSVMALQHFHGRSPDDAEMLHQFEPRLEVAMEAMQGRCNALFDPRDDATQFPTPFLNMGCKVGIVGGTDHFRGGPNRMGMTGFWVKELSREGVWEALRNRYTLGVSNARIAMSATLAGQPMGSSVAVDAGADVRIRLAVSCGRAIRRATLIRDGHMLPWTTVDAMSAVVELVDPDVSPGRHWYVPTVEVDTAFGPTTPGYGHTSPFFVLVRGPR